MHPVVSDHKWPWSFCLQAAGKQQTAIVCHCFNLLVNSEGGNQCVHSACIVSAI